ncbi:MAG: hypothetical protein SLAVMIC_00759 [uncultured marine phage]|uniref:Uncharacterized protein n=1 Tax=uncultured marine phage TaxID=707152 RepID=A0A8D9CC36_9VIRU|nr:MAG: hypothetical protein SLAVMIC_00759 [uncultured marine phage]
MTTEHLFTKEEYWRSDGETRFTACGIEVNRMTSLIVKKNHDGVTKMGDIKTAFTNDEETYKETVWGTNVYESVNCPHCLEKYPPFVEIDGVRFEHEEKVMVEFTSYASGEATLVFKANCQYVGQETGWYIRDYYREYRSIDQMESIKKILTPEQIEREERLSQILDKEDKKWWKFWKK